ncbi:hypothetical protein GCM10020220_018770 [Nonomuraea rubra]
MSVLRPCALRAPRGEARKQKEEIRIERGTKHFCPSPAPARPSALELGAAAASAFAVTGGGCIRPEARRGTQRTVAYGGGRLQRKQT